jgi:hypothetical protein
MADLRAAQQADGQGAQDLAGALASERLFIFADLPQRCSRPAQQLPLIDRPKQVYRRVCESHETNVPSSDPTL